MRFVGESLIWQILQTIKLLLKNIKDRKLLSYMRILINSIYILTNQLLFHGV